MLVLLLGWVVEFGAPPHHRTTARALSSVLLRPLCSQENYLNSGLIKTTGLPILVALVVVLVVVIVLCV